VAGVGHDYDGLVALDGIDLDIPPGEVTVLVGPSGCGKSTLLGILGGLLRPARGRVTLTGAPGADCLNPLTYVFQDFALLPWRTVAGNVSLVLEHHPLSRAARAARVAEVLEITGLAAFARAWPRQLSGGMRQRLGIARALAVRPAVLLMDEPLSALDAQTRDLLLEEMEALIARAGATVVWVTHNLAEAARLGARGAGGQIVVLSRRPGRIRAVLRPAGTGPAGRAATEAELWALIREDAAAAARELADG
jgi:NitT/TauT family transport system ATP-binding protein